MLCFSASCVYAECSVVSAVPFFSHISVWCQNSWTCRQIVCGLLVSLF